jgi:hypothetical protein
MRFHSLLVLLLCIACASTLAWHDPVVGCDGQVYPEPEVSPYVIPFPVGMTVETGLANCSESFHGPNSPERYATDFDMPEGTVFTAARGGVVARLVEDSEDEIGNWLHIDHDDDTSALYAHSPVGGIYVEVGDRVEPGDTLGIVGQSGQAGYPHLHFIVVKDPARWPFDPVPVSFRNADPGDVALRCHSTYTALSY